MKLILLEENCIFYNFLFCENLVIAIENENLFNEANKCTINCETCKRIQIGSQFYDEIQELKIEPQE